MLLFHRKLTGSFRTWKNTRKIQGFGEVSMVKFDNMDGILDYYKWM